MLSLKSTFCKRAVPLNAPILYALGLAWLFTISLSGPFLVALLSDDVLHDSYFVLFPFDYVLVGGIIWASLGALHHRLAKMAGKACSETGARVALVVTFLSLNLALVSRFFMGYHGMPRRYSDSMPRVEVYHQLSNAGTVIAGLGLAVMAYTLVCSLVRYRER